MRIADEVLAVLSDAEVSGNELRLTGTLDRKMYVKVNDVLEAAGGKWNRKLKAHIFESDAAERIDEIILSGEIEKPKDEFNFFPTPQKIVDMILDRAKIKEGMKILEPSAGHGAIALRCVEEGAEVDCVELMEANYKKLIETEAFGFVENADFLSIPNVLYGYDRVCMNPPFMKRMDIKHVNHAHKFLKPDGLLVAIMSAGVTFRNDKLTSEFREFVKIKGGKIEPLPDGAFKESGTMVRTVIVEIPA